MNDTKIFNELKDYYLKLLTGTEDLIRILGILNIDLNSCSLNYKPSFLFRKYIPEVTQLKVDDSNFKKIISNINFSEIGYRSDRYYYIKAFANILYWAEKVLFYPNDDDKSVYSIIKEEDKLICIYFNISDDITVEIKFQESAINLPNRSKDNPLNFMDDNQDTYATFIEIGISRNFGNNIYTNFKTILGSDEFGLSNEDDTYTLDIVESKIGNIIINSLYDIERYIVKECCGLDKEISIEDLKNGITVWRPVTKSK